MSKRVAKLLGGMPQHFNQGRQRVEDYLNHDCHLSPESGCKVCEKYWGYTKGNAFRMEEQENQSVTEADKEFVRTHDRGAYDGE